MSTHNGHEERNGQAPSTQAPMQLSDMIITRPQDQADPFPPKDDDEDAQDS